MCSLHSLSKLSQSVNILLYSELRRYPNKNSHNETYEKGSGEQHSLSGAPLFFFLFPLRCATAQHHQKSLSIFGRNRTLSEHVAQLRFGKKTCKSVHCIYSIVNRRLQSRTIEGDLHFFLSLSKGLDQGLKDAGRMWPLRAFCAGRNAFWEFSNN